MEGKGDHFRFAGGGRRGSGADAVHRSGPYNERAVWKTALYDRARRHRYRRNALVTRDTTSGLISTFMRSFALFM